MYLFTKNAKTQQAFLDETSCGSVCINDVIMQFTGENRNSWVTSLGFLSPIFRLALDSSTISLFLKQLVV